MSACFAVIIEQLAKRTADFYLVDAHSVDFFLEVRPKLKRGQVNGVDSLRFRLSSFFITFLAVVVADFIWQHHH